MHEARMNCLKAEALFFLLIQCIFRYSTKYSGGHFCENDQKMLLLAGNLKNKKKRGRGKS